MHKNFCKHCDGESDEKHVDYCDWCGAEMPKDPTGYEPRVELPEPKAWKEHHGLDYTVKAAILLKAGECDENGWPRHRDLDICLDCMLLTLLAAKGEAAPLPAFVVTNEQVEEMYVQLLAAAQRLADILVGGEPGSHAQTRALCNLICLLPAKRPPRDTTNATPSAPEGA